MSVFEVFFVKRPYEYSVDEKTELLDHRLAELTAKHYNNCEAYRNIMNMFGYDINGSDSYYDIPFIPVRLFKELELKSVPSENVLKTLTSSGTTGQSVSKIFLDRETASNQQKVLVKIVSDFTGATRMPMIIIDCPSVIKDRRLFSARGAGILGFSIFGKDKIFALDDDMNLNTSAIREFIDAHPGKKILLFGFTFMIWQHFLKALKNEGLHLDLSDSILIHGGGWKKLASEMITREQFHQALFDACSISDIHDYYGMVEQTGCIYMECEYGYLHTSVFSDVIVRRPSDFSIAEEGETGIIEVVSSIPESYPGHVLLTEDIGSIVHKDGCKCGRKGKCFVINGRIRHAELRGCSDTYAAEHG